MIKQTAEVIRGAFQFVAALAVNDLVRYYITINGGGRRAKWAYAALALASSVIMSLALVYIQHGYDSFRFKTRFASRRQKKTAPSGLTSQLPLGKTSQIDSRAYVKLGI